MRKRTLFYGIPLIGKNTGFVESLRSYIFRLAAAHSVRPGVLLQLLIDHFPLDGLTLSFKELRTRWDIHGLGKIGIQLILRLEMATAQTLELSSLARFSGLLSNRYLLSSDPYRYCAVCSNQTSGDSFSPLLWQVECVNACPIHGVLLKSSRKCGSPLDSKLGPHQRPLLNGVCGTCGSIGFKCATDNPEIASDEAIQASRSVSSFLSLSGEDSRSLSVSVTIRGLREVVSQRYEGSAVRAAEQSGLSRGAVCHWLRGSGTFSFAKMVQLCNHAGADLVACSKGSFQPASTPSGNVPEFPKYRKRVKRDWSLIARAIENALHQGEIISGRQFARRFDMDLKYLKKHLPDESRRLIATYQASKDAQREKNYNASISFFLLSVAALKRDGKAINRTSILRHSRVALFRKNSSYNKDSFKNAALEKVLELHADYRPNGQRL